jgi:hypothetical protein|tara:strand:- start:48 stop:242 length:195 start_codon:yes stop_codon:yes gene_type:complete
VVVEVEIGMVVVQLLQLNPVEDQVVVEKVQALQIMQQQVEQTKVVAVVADVLEMVVAVQRVVQE